MLKIVKWQDNHIVDEKGYHYVESYGIIRCYNCVKTKECYFYYRYKGIINTYFTYCTSCIMFADDLASEDTYAKLKTKSRAILL